MVEERLSDDAIEAGRRFVGCLDAIGLRPEGVAWLYAHSIQEWRFIVATAAVDQIGRRKIYGAITDLFRAHDFGPTLTDADVHLASPSEWWYALMASAVRAEAGAVHLRNCVFNGVRVDGVIYRLIMPAKPLDARRRSSAAVKAARKAAEAVDNAEKSPAL